jgi:hypothetical protein
MNKNVFLVLFGVLFFLNFNVQADNVYKGRIIGEDKSRIEDIMFEDTVAKEVLDDDKNIDLPGYESELPEIPSYKIQPVLDIDILPDEKVKFTEIEEEEVKKEHSPFERVSANEPENPRRMKYIMYSLIGFFVLFAIF